MNHFRKKLWKILISTVCLVMISSAFAETYYTAKDKFISYTDVGSGKPLVLIHAFPTDLRLWDPQQDTLKKYFRVISLDLWGFGKSSAVDGKSIKMTDYA